MGFYHSKFIDALRRGSDEEARAHYTTRKSVRDSVEPNTSLGPTHGDNSVLHYAALHAMEWLYRDLLLQGGKPDMRNGVARNSLHLVCTGRNRPRSRETILRLTLEEGLGGMDVEHILRERDEEGNTVLHLAASSGLTKCVELLLDYKADLYITNKKEQTAADCAAECKRTAIATLLETRMVFAAEEEGNSAPPAEPDHAHLKDLAEAPSGMRDSDLRSMKDQLLIETSELLGVSLFTSEALLRHHGWSKEELLDAWMDNPAEACEKAGVQLPSNLGMHNMDTSLSPRAGEGTETECGVCLGTFSPDIVVPCGHVFCRDCWRQYLHQRIESGDAHSIACPEFTCYKLVPLEVIEAVVSREMAQRYLRFDIRAFVESHPTIRWCPHPDCHRAVRLTTPPDSSDVTPQPTTVHCGNEHYFCWSCSSDPHVPVSCEDWKQWLDHVREMAPQIGEGTASQLDDAASQRWLATRSKPCPKCKAPIEKTDGCNHMCCKKCRHDFCWVCLDEWKQHNTSTGGYFECNRYEVRRKADSQLQKHKEKALEGVEEAEQLRRFIHYYERYKSHRESLQLELPFLKKANQKTEALRASILKLDSSRRYTVSVDMSFIEEAIRELLAARRVLIASYAFGYYVQGRQARRLFENMQGTLEQTTEELAQVVARPHLRKPRADIIRITRECQAKRMWLLKDYRTLPEPTPPGRRRRRHAYNALRFGRGCDSDDTSNSSSPEAEGPDLMAILRGLSTRRRSPRPRSNTEQEMMRAMELSRREHQERTQLEADIERAKQLSLADSCDTQPTADVGLLFLDDTPPPWRRPARPSPDASCISFPYFPSPSQRHGANISPPHTPPPPSRSSVPVFPTPHHIPPLRPPIGISPPSPCPVAAETPNEVDSSVNSSPASQDWDEEELAKALSLSLMESSQPNSTTPAALDGRGCEEQYVQLPPELRLLLQDNHRIGQNV